MDVAESPARGPSGRKFAPRGRQRLDGAAPGGLRDAGLPGPRRAQAPGPAGRHRSRLGPGPLSARIQRFFFVLAAVFRHPLLRSLPVLLLPLVSACQQQGLSGRDAEWARRQAEGFRVASASHEGVVINARGQMVLVDPAPGFCVAEESIETSKRSVFILIGDCAVEGPISESKDARGELHLPKSVPGIMTVSISGDPGFRAEDGSYGRLLEFLKTAEGRSMLGRSGSGEGVAIQESRESDGALMLYLEDNSTDVVPILSNRFWRAFIELHGRLAVVTMSGFRDRPLDREKMFAYLVSQVQTLGVANEAVPEAPETRLAAADGTGGTDDASDSWVNVLTGGTTTAAATAAATADGAADGAATRAAGTPETAAAPVPEIPRGNSPLERIMVLPPPRPGSGRPAARVAGRPAAAGGSALPSATSDETAPVRPILTPSTGKTALAPTSERVPAPDAGSPTKYAPRTAPIAPKRR